MNPNRTEDLGGDSQSLVKTELVSPIVSRHTVIPATGHTLPAHLMLMLETWHHENPRVQPPGSYRRSPVTPRDNSQAFSRTGGRLSETAVLINYPVRYQMIVLYSEQQPAKFVVCLLSGPRTFFKEWLGGHEFAARTCAVRQLILKKSGEPMVTSEEMFKAADLRMPIRKARAGTAVIPPENGRGSSSTATSYNAETACTEQDTSDDSNSSGSEPISATVQRRRRQQTTEVERSSSTQDNHSRGTIIFELVTPEATRCFAVEPSNTGDDLFKKCTEFFHLFGMQVTMPILVCTIPGEEKLRYLFDGREMDILLRSLREQAIGQGELTVEVKYKG